MAVLAFVVCMVMSPMYFAMSQLMPPQQSSASAAAQILGNSGDSPAWSWVAVAVPYR